MAVQGFGKVGMHACIEAHALGARILAVSDRSGGVFNPKGINITDLINYVRENRFIKNYPKAEAITNKELLVLDVDALLPCALGNVVNEKNMKDIKAKLIVEGANGPVTYEANEYLVAKNILVVPDILANGGGVVVSYFEWVQDIGWLFWKEKEIRYKLRDIMYESFDRIWKFSEKQSNTTSGQPIDLHLGAMSVSLIRLEKAMKLRGQAW